MILAIDMGNTNIKIGLVKDEKNIIEERISTEYDRTSLEYAEHIMFVLEFYNVKASDISGAILSSVVPPLTAVLSAAVNKVLGIRPIIVSNRLRSEVTFADGVGADLIAAGEAAHAFYGGPCIMANLGTATTITVVTEDCIFRGGVILPGMKTSLKALSQGAAVLPEISFDRPGSVISLNTVECMRSGIIYGSAAQIDGIAERMEEEMGEKCTLLLTGGMARFCEPYIRHGVIRDDALIMKGLYRLYEENR
ncbi:MAG: type III pantothenate kinase [Lachnospiraceae bacterium]|nr:type III pantothenate kinase [Lachnospiraceae bacterium]